MSTNRVCYWRSFFSFGCVRAVNLFSFFFVCARNYFFFVFFSVLMLLLLLLLLLDELPYKMPLISGGASPAPGAAGVVAVVGAAGAAGAFLTTATVAPPQIVQFGALCRSQTMTRTLRTGRATTRRL